MTSNLATSARPSRRRRLQQSPSSPSPATAETQAPLTFYPRYVFKHSKVFNTWAKLTAADIYRLHIAPGFEGQNIYFYLNHPIRWVRLVGIITSFEQFEELKRTSINLDDGSGASIELVYFDDNRDQPNQGRFAKPQGALPIDFNRIELHSVIKAKGEIAEYRDTRQILLRKIEVLSTTNAEVRAWQDASAFKRDILMKPWVIDKQTLKKEERKLLRAQEEDDRERKRQKLEYDKAQYEDLAATKWMRQTQSRDEFDHAEPKLVGWIAPDEGEAIQNPQPIKQELIESPPRIVGWIGPEGSEQVAPPLPLPQSPIKEESPEVSPRIVGWIGPEDFDENAANAQEPRQYPLKKELEALPPPRIIGWMGPEDRNEDAPGTHNCQQDRVKKESESPPPPRITGWMGPEELEDSIQPVAPQLAIRQERPVKVEEPESPPRIVGWIGPESLEPVPPLDKPIKEEPTDPPPRIVGWIGPVNKFSPPHISVTEKQPKHFVGQRRQKPHDSQLDRAASRSTSPPPLKRVKLEPQFDTVADRAKIQERLQRREERYREAIRQGKRVTSSHQNHHRTKENRVKIKTEDKNTDAADFAIPPRKEKRKAVSSTSSSLLSRFPSGPSPSKATTAIQQHPQRPSPPDPNIHSSRALKLLLLRHIHNDPIPTFTIPTLRCNPQIEEFARKVAFASLPPSIPSSSSPSNLTIPSTINPISSTSIAIAAHIFKTYRDVVDTLVNDGNLIREIRKDGTHAYIAVGRWNLGEMVVQAAEKVKIHTGKGRRGERSRGQLLVRNLWLQVQAKGGGWEGVTKGVVGEMVREVLLEENRKGKVGGQWTDIGRGVWEWVYFNDL